MLERPIFKPHLRTTVVDGAGLFILSELRQIVLQGRLFEWVAPLLDGRPVEAVCRQLRDVVSPAQVFYTIRALEQRGLLVEAADPAEAEPSPAAAAWWALQDIPPDEQRARLAQTPVALTGLGVDVGPVAAWLADLGVRLTERSQDARLQVVLTDHYLHRDLPAINRAAIDRGQPWLLAKPRGAIVWIGPIFAPGITACWECLAERIRANFPVLGYLESMLPDQGLPEIDVAGSAATLGAAGGLAATAAANWIARGGSLPYLNDSLQTINLVSLASESHPVIRQPACGACGTGPADPQATPAPLVLEPRKKSYTEDGGHRSTSPEETLQTYRHLISPISGAVTMLERSPAGDQGVMHVYISGNNIARGPESLFNLKVDLRNLSAGKGINELQAKASALCEGLERYSGIFRGDEPRRLARMDDLGDAAIHPNECMRFSDTQYQQREERNARASVYNDVPDPFDPQAELEWTPVWSLTRQAYRYLPTAQCYFNYPQEEAFDFCRSCSNGNAAGNSLEEAILQGFLELVERDAVSLWWYNRVRVPGIDLDSFDEPYLDRLREFFATRHRQLWALDLTNDLGIPAIAALSCRTDGEHEHLMFGFGAHLEPRIALLRAVTELNQMLTPLIDVAPGDPIARLNDADTLRWVKTASRENQPYVVPQSGPLRTAASYDPTWSDDLCEDIQRCRSIVERQGLELLVLDQTRPEIGMPVVKVIVPGLRHFWMRFGPGRLFQVPVELGWRDTPIDEDRLNPIPMFL